MEEAAAEEKNKNDEDNEWGITCDDDAVVPTAAAPAGASALPAGVWCVCVCVCVCR